MRLRPLVALLFLAGAAGAEPAIPGTRVASHDDLGQRRAIRGETLEAHESEELRALRRFEEEELLPSLARPAPVLSIDGEPPAAYSTLALPDVPVRWDARVVRFLDFYKSDRRGRAIMTSWLRAQGRYRAMIEDALKRHHLPHALLYIAMIESGYDPLDRSFAGASGLWQFMPEAARIYGLRVDHWVDERNDPEKATEAQMRYFDDLRARFGSWHLALAAFNAGYGAALAASAKYNTNDYWELCRHEDGLPWETTLYVPKFLAAAVVGENRAAFAYDAIEAEPAFAYDAVQIDGTITIDEAARAAGVSASQVTALNPELRQGRTPPAEKWTLKLPTGSGPRFLARAAALPGRDKLATYTVRLGDRVDTIARAHKLPAARLRKQNGIRDDKEVRPGMVLLMPPGTKASPRDDRGDKDEAEVTLVPLADKEAIVEGRKRVLYRVAPGDAVGALARHFQVAEEDIVRWNRLDPRARLSSGLILQLWVDKELDVRAEGGAVIDLEGPQSDDSHVRLVTTGSEEFLDLVEARRGRKRVTVAARAGDTLKKVGMRYGLTEGDMERINRMGRATALKPGDPLVVYVAMTETERAEATKRLAQGALPALPAAIEAESEPGRDAVGGDDPRKAPSDDAPASVVATPIEDPGLDASAFAIDGN